MHYDYLIAGAGLFGAVFAHEMHKQGRKVLVVEKRDHIAGNIYTEKVMGINVHRYGAHIFHTSDEEVWNYVNQYARFNHYVNSPVAVYRDELYNLPFNMNTFSRMWNIKTPKEAKEIIAKQTGEFAGITPQNLEEQALQLAGRDVYEKLIKGYTEKQWGRDCKDLPAFIIRRLPLRFTYDNNYFNDRFQGIPEGGYTQIVEKLLEDIPVLTGVSLQEYQTANAARTADEQDSWDRLLYTGMIDEYYHYRLGTLEYRSLRFETEELPEEDTVEELAEEPAYEPEAEEFEEPAEPEAEIYEQEEIVDEEQAEPEEAMDDEPVEEPTAEAVESVDEETASEEIELTAEETPEAGEAPEQPERPAVERDKAKVRALTREERELYAPFIQSRSAREQLVKAIDNISLAAYTGNVIITGEEGMDTLSLAKNMVREIQATDSNFSGKVAKISGHALNKKDTADTLSKLKNGALIICKASEMNDATANVLHKALQQESQGIVIILEDTKRDIDKFLEKHEKLRECFTARMDVEALSNNTLVAFGKQYAREMEYSIDELGELALHTRIEDMQTIDYVVTVVDVKQIVDEAINHANKKTLKHFFDVLFAKRYDDEDMIILTEKDFV